MGVNTERLWIESMAQQINEQKLREGMPANEDDWKLFHHAIYWGRLNQMEVPEYGTPEFMPFYEKWHAFAFEGFPTADDTPEEALRKTRRLRPKKSKR
jgi:hypothetical protein